MVRNYCIEQRNGSLPLSSLFWAVSNGQWALSTVKVGACEFNQTNINIRLRNGQGQKKNPLEDWRNKINSVVVCCVQEAVKQDKQCYLPCVDCGLWFSQWLVKRTSCRRRWWKNNADEGRARAGEKTESLSPEECEIWDFQFRDFWEREEKRREKTDFGEEKRREPLIC